MISHNQKKSPMNYNYSKNAFIILNKIHDQFLVFCLTLVVTSFGKLKLVFHIYREMELKLIVKKLKI
jgi:hypothetical protein